MGSTNTSSTSCSKLSVQSLSGDSVSSFAICTCLCLFFIMALYTGCSMNTSITSYASLIHCGTQSRSHLPSLSAKAWTCGALLPWIVKQSTSFDQRPLLCLVSFCSLHFFMGYPLVWSLHKCPLYSLYQAHKPFIICQKGFISLLMHLHQLFPCLCSLNRQVLLSVASNTSLWISAKRATTFLLSPPLVYSVEGAGPFFICSPHWLQMKATIFALSSSYQFLFCTYASYICYSIPSPQPLELYLIP